jgi:hypothetical protein
MYLCFDRRGGEDGDGVRPTLPKIVRPVHGHSKKSLQLDSTETLARKCGSNPAAIPSIPYLNGFPPGTARLLPANLVTIARQGMSGFAKSWHNSFRVSMGRLQILD